MLLPSCYAEIGAACSEEESFFNAFVVGDFPEAEARAFLNKCLKHCVKSEVSDEDWKTVYQVGQSGVLVLPHCSTQQHHQLEYRIASVLQQQSSLVSPTGAARR